MNCNDCCYNLPKDGHSYCTYEDGECIKISMLEKENAELNGKLLEQKQYTEFKCNEAVKKKEIYEREHFLLTKAKEIIKKFSEFVNSLIEYDPEHPQEHTVLWNELCENAEQFLKDCEVEK